MKSVFHIKISNIIELKLSGSFLLVTILLLISLKGSGQKDQCVNGPTVNLSSTSGGTCSNIAITVSGNVFGGSATTVTITENGSGSVNPSFSTTSPFSFTYTPASGDIGKTVSITVTTNNPSGAPCKAAKDTYKLTVNSNLQAPVVGTITQPTCTIATGSVLLYGLPATGNWTINPGEITGTGTSKIITGLDAGTYNFTVTNATGCSSVPSVDVVIYADQTSPTAPTVGTISQPTCTISTGSVELSGLPATGEWTVIRSPGGITKTGTGTVTTITTIPSGTYSFQVMLSSGCISPPSASFTINDQPSTPLAPSINTITPPTCTLPTGSVVLTGLPTSGTWTLTRYPGIIKTTGTDAVVSISGLPAGTYNYTVTNQEGCISVPSGNVIITLPPPAPTVPVIETIIQPTFSVPTGSVILSGLPSSGAWTLTRLPDEVTKVGSGTSYTITGLAGGIYTFTVTNSIGCVSDVTIDVVISTPGPPKIIITDPPAECSPATVDLTTPEITAGSTTGLTYTYWTDSEAKVAYGTPSAATSGTYFIKGTTASGFYDIKSITVTIVEKPVPNAGPDQILDYITSATLEAVLSSENETGIWSVISGTGVLDDVADPGTAISGLSSGENILQWTVSNGVCPLDSDRTSITVGKLKIPTLITPNGDPMNEYFKISGMEALGKTELIIFDSRGALIYKNSDYDNKWNGVDYNEDPLPNDTYFYILNTARGNSYSGYIVIRR